MNTHDWTQGGHQIHHQQCPACDHRWYFRREFCPSCGQANPDTHASTGLGRVHASTLVHRAPSEEFRAIVPYRIVLVDLVEGVRVMGHAEVEVQLEDQVRCEIRTIAGRNLPFFVRELHVS